MRERPATVITKRILQVFNVFIFVIMNDFNVIFGIMTSLLA